MNLIRATFLALLSYNKFAGAFDSYRIENLWKSYYVIPSELLNRHDLNAMGLHKELQEYQNLDTSSLGRNFKLDIPVTGTDISLPRNSSLLFLFNSSSIRESTDKVFNEAGKCVHTGLPFNFPKYHLITSAFLMIPVDLLRNGQLERFPYVRSDLWLSQIGIPRESIPLHHNLLKHPCRPVLVLVFQSGTTAEDFDAFDKASRSSDNTSALGMTREKISDALTTSSSLIAKAVLFSNDDFFDRFANVWARSLGIESLFHSVFCQIDLRASEMSYCLQLSSSSADIFIFDKNSNTLSDDNSPRSKRALPISDNIDLSVLAAEEMYPVMMNFFEVMISNYTETKNVLQNCRCADSHRAHYQC